MSGINKHETFVKQRRPITRVGRAAVSYVHLKRKLSLNISKKVAIYSDLDELKLK